MVRDRDHESIARRTLQDGRRLLAAWDAYLDKTRALAGVRPCTAVNRSTGHLCQLVADHRGRHRHRPLGLTGGQLPPTEEWE